MNGETKPRVLLVYYTLTKQSGRVADAMTQELEARGCEVAKALIEFTDERWVPKLSQFPMKRPIPQIAIDSHGAAPPQDRRDPPFHRRRSRATTTSWCSLSPTWWFQTSMPIRSYLESPEAKTVLEREAVRLRVDLTPLLQHQPRAAEEAR